MQTAATAQADFMTLFGAVMGTLATNAKMYSNRFVLAKAVFRQAGK